MEGSREYKELQDNLKFKDVVGVSRDSGGRSKL